MILHRAAAVTSVAAALAASGCVFRSAPATVPAGESARFGAALAHLTVDNRTPHRLTIAYRPATGPGGLVGVGTVDAGDTRDVAPIPAGEPIRLSARTPTGAELVLESRSFHIDEEWVWEIPADARFRPPGDR
jgi:hypothetical protein